tara:strand:+ start:10955 stop:12334 length:1380 start_codon:yes stop_codon:yes gene_type:complete
MSNLNPPKLLSVGIQVQSVTAYWAASTPQKDIDGNAKQWRLQMNVNAQLHSAVESTIPFQYDGRNIAVGDYVATGANGLLLKIDTIESANVSTVVCLASDEDRLNALMDQTQFGDGGILSGPGICFEVENQMPVLFPLPSILPAGFSRGFATQILSRFLLRETRDILTIEQAGHGLARKQAVVLNNTGQYEAVDYTAADATMTKRIIGIVEEPNWPTDNHFRIRTVGPIIDIMLGGNPGTLYFVDPSSTTGQLFHLDPNSAQAASITADPVYIIIDNERAIFFASGLVDNTSSTQAFIVANQTELAALTPGNGDTAFVIDGGNPLGLGEWAYYIYQGGVWNTLSTQDGGGAASQTSFKATISHSGMNTVNIHRVDHNVRVLNVSVEVTTAFNGGASVTVGDNNNFTRHMSAGENDLSEVGTYYSFPNHLYDLGAEIHVSAFLNKGAATVGEAEVLITYA